MLTVIEEYTREALCVTVKRRMGSADVLEALYPLLLRRGKPAFIRSDNGKEFTAELLTTWLKKLGVKPMQIYPGSPWENGYNERFNGTLRREVLNAEWFSSTHGSASTIKSALIRRSTCVRQSRKLWPHMAHDNGAG